MKQPQLNWIGDYEIRLITAEYLDTVDTERMKNGGFLKIHKEVTSGNKTIFVFARPKEIY